MKESLISKSLAVAVILLFIGMSVIPLMSSGETGKTYITDKKAYDDPENTNISSEHSFNVVSQHSFGYERIGSAYSSIDDRIKGSVFIVLEDGIANNITAYTWCSTPISKSKCMIYRANDSKFIGATEELTPPYGSAEWTVFSFAEPKPILEKDTKYVLTSWSYRFAYLYYDNCEDEQGRRDDEEYGNPPDPADFTNENRVYSIYCSYTPDSTPSENALVCGFVTDKDTGSPIEGVRVRLWWTDGEGNYDENETYTNTSGYYGMHTKAGRINLHFYAGGYFNEHKYDYIIDSYETLWVNISLFPIPPVTVTICGYIKDKNTGDPIPSADVEIDWKDDYGHWWYNHTHSNASGFYRMGAPAGNIRIYAYADGYFYEYSNYYFVEENETFWINLSLEPKPPQTAVVCGYITDKMNGEPIEDADVDLDWRDDEGHYDYNYTYTDGIGFYKMNTAPGRIRIYAYKSNYNSQSSPYYWIEDNQTLWVNISLSFVTPDESLVACGYVLDTVTHAPVKYAYVRYDWKDNVGHIYSKYTYADRAGFYQINVPPGSAQFYITGHGYRGFSTPWYIFNESKPVTWINVSISPEITVAITKPVPGFYIDDFLKTPLLSKFLSWFMPNFKPIIIGPITIEANVTQNTSGVNRVDFYIDDVFQVTDTIEPYNFTWNKTAFFTHQISVIAYDNAGPLNIDTLLVRKFF